MRTPAITWTLVLAAVPSFVSLALAGGGLSYTSNRNGDQTTLTCDDIELRFWDEDRKIVTSRRSERVTLQMDGSTPFKITAADRGGVRVQPSVDGRFSASICLAAGTSSAAEGEKLLDRLTIVNNRGELTVSGPDDADWAAEILVSAPDGVNLDLSASNGGLELHTVSGQFRMRSTNGPLSIKNVEGSVDARAQNGPISFHGHHGDVELETQNGPVSVRLDETTWKGKGLVARTQNGPINVRTPDGMKSAVQVDAGGYSPTNLNGVSMPMTNRYGGARRISFGDGPTLVRVSTVNGPVNVHSRSVVKQKDAKQEIRI